MAGLTTTNLTGESHERMTEAGWDRLRGVAAGTLAMLALLVVVVVLRQLTEVTSLLDTLAEALLLYMPMGMFSLSLDLFGPQAKTMLLAGLMLVLLLIGAWLGDRYARGTTRPQAGLWTKSLTYGIGLYVVFAAIMYLFLADQSPDVMAGSRALPILGQLALAVGAFVLVLPVSLEVLRGQGNASDREGIAGLSRRQLVGRVAGFGAVAGGVWVVGSAVARVANRPTVGVSAPGEISPAITPNDDFYVISKNFVDPDPDRGEDWFVTVDGVVGQEMRFTRADLESISKRAFISTLTCISNPVGGPLIGTAEWVGAPLSDVLRKVGVGEGAVKVVFTGEDDYTDSITIERAMQPEPMLVWQMNGVPLPRLHGTPVRVIVPGIYGMKNVKWLTKITVSNDNYQGFWQERGWTDPAIVKTSSRIDVPGDSTVLAQGPTTIGGVAFGGDRGISAVEVSTDGGDSWQEATILENPSPAGLSWVTWSLEWRATNGTHDIVVRATDGMGDLQTEDSAPELPDGSSGWHRIRVGVA